MIDGGCKSRHSLVLIKRTLLAFFPHPFQIRGKIMIRSVVPRTVHEIATCHFQCTLITVTAWAADGG